MRDKRGMHKDFLSLPPATSIKSELPRSTLFKTSVPQRIQVGSVCEYPGPYAGSSRLLYAYIDCGRSTMDPNGVLFCFSNDSIISRKYVARIELLHPFDSARCPGEATEDLVIPLSTLVTYYFLARDFVKELQWSTDHLELFEETCVAYANHGRYESYPRNSGMTCHVLRQKRYIVGESDDDSQREGEARFERSEERTSESSLNDMRIEEVTLSRTGKETQRR